MASDPRKRDPRASTLQQWAQRRPPEAPPPPAAALAYVDAAGDPERAAEAAAILALLDGMGADTPTLASALLYAFDDPDHPPPGELLAEPVATLLAGQRAARRVWEIYEQRGAHGSTEGLRRLLLAIVRDLRVVLVLLARQLVRMRRADALPEQRQRALAQL